jgi:hypothetical protein
MIKIIAYVVIFITIAVAIIVCDYLKLSVWFISIYIALFTILLIICLIYYITY